MQLGVFKVDGMAGEAALTLSFAAFLHESH
jgi:hypothetical protein